MNEVERQLAKARQRPGFMDRLRDRIEQDRPILDRLEALEHAEQNRVTDAVMEEVRRLATHQHRFPYPNYQGFPVDQCVECGYWRSAPPVAPGADREVSDE